MNTYDHILNRLNLNDKQALQFYLEGASSEDPTECIKELSLLPIDNKAIHDGVRFAAQAYLLPDDDEVLLIANSQEEVEKLLYYVGGENEKNALLFKYGKVWIFNEAVAERFEQYKATD